VEEYIIRGLETWGIKILYVVILLFVGFRIIKIVGKIIEKALDKSKIEESVKTFLLSFTQLGLKALLLISAAATLGIEMTSFAALIGSIGIAIGFSLQGSLSNFSGGIIILILKPFVVGDYIEGAGHSGTVREITIVYTYLTTPDNKVVAIPNGQLSNSSIINYTKNKLRRVDFKFGVSYDSDIVKVKKIIADVVEKHEKILDEPESIIRLSNHGDSSLDFSVKVWCVTKDYWGIYYDLTEQIKEAFDKENIEIPYPHMVNIVKNN